MHPTGVGGGVGALQPGRLAKLGQLAEYMNPTGQPPASFVGEQLAGVPP